MRLIIFFILIPIYCFGQLKYERERRLAKEQVPDLARQFLKFPKKQSIRWFEEEAYGNWHSVEAKFCYQGQKYSVEFDSLGQLQDIEIKLRKLPKAVKVKFEQKLLIPYRIQKVQQQYQGDLEHFLDLFEQKKNSIILI